jgi:hypothetical protein
MSLLERRNNNSHAGLELSWVIIYQAEYRKEDQQGKEKGEPVFPKNQKETFLEEFSTSHLR